MGIQRDYLLVRTGVEQKHPSGLRADAVDRLKLLQRHGRRVDLEHAPERLVNAPVLPQLELAKVVAQLAPLDGAVYASERCEVFDLGWVPELGVLHSHVVEHRLDFGSS